MSDKLERPATVRLTPAGEQIEDALADGYDVAAFNLYALSFKDEVKLTKDDSDESVAWHRWVHEQVDWPESSDDDLDERLREELLREEMLEGFTPSLEERTIRNQLGEVIGLEVVAHKPDESEPGTYRVVHDDEGEEGSQGGPARSTS